MMRRYSEILITAISIVGASSGLAGAVELQPYSHVYSVTANVAGRTAVTSRWQDTLEEVTVAGKEAFRRTQISLQSNGRARTWISLFEQATLAPVADTFNTSDGEIFARTFADGSATDYSSSGLTKGLMTTSRTALPPGYSDFNGGQFGLALLQLPLAPGFKTTLTTFGATDAAIQYVPVEVLRQEQLRVGACVLPTFVIRATFQAKYYPDEGENYMTFWLAQRPPYVARLVTDAPEKHLSVSFDLGDTETACPASHGPSTPKGRVLPPA